MTTNISTSNEFIVLIESLKLVVNNVTGLLVQAVLELVERPKWHA
jgi:hypothetical protein